MVKKEDCYELEQWLQLTETPGSANTPREAKVTLHATQTAFGVDTNKGVWVKLTIRVPKRLFSQYANAVLDLSAGPTMDTQYQLDPEVITHDLMDLKDSLE